MAVGKYESNGIKLSKKIIYKGDKIKVTYNGLLAQSGAERIYLHYGFGSDWTDSSFVQMNKVDEGFSAEIHILHQTNLGLCFKDSADNWDNNSGENYLYGISVKAQKKTDTNEPKDSKQSDKTLKEKTSTVKKASTDKKTSAEKKASPAKKASTKKKATVEVLEAL